MSHSDTPSAKRNTDIAAVTSADTMMDSQGQRKGVQDRADGAKYVHSRDDNAVDVLATAENNLNGSLTFTAGGTVNSPKDFVYDAASKSWYYWSGSFPFTFEVASSPASNNLWLCSGDHELTAKLATSSYGTGIINTILPLAGAVARTQQERNADWVSVKDFGAVGDDSRDATSAFRAANSASLYIYVPEGTYKITDTLNLRDGTILMGAGKFLTKLRLYDNDVDLIIMGWDCILENISLESMLPSGPTYKKGLVRWQSITNIEIPPAAIPGGGLSYRNKIRNVEMRNGQNYNFYSFGIGYAEWHNTDSLLSRGNNGILLDGSSSYMGRGTTLYMSGVNKVTAGNAGGIAIINQFAMRINAIFEGNKGRAVTVYGYADSIIIDGYYENNFTAGEGAGDGVVKFESGITRGCEVHGYFDTLNADYAVLIGSSASGFNNRAQYNVRELNDARTYNRANGFKNEASGCEWSVDNALQYYKEADLGQIRSSGKLTFTQCMAYTPYSLLRNPKFNAWSGSAPDNWTGSAVKNHAGFCGSDYYATLNSYPTTYLQQSGIQVRMERGAGNYNLVMTGRGGHTIGPVSSDYNGTNRAVIIMSTAAGNTFIEIPQQNFGHDWTTKIVNLNEILAADFPVKSAIIAMTILIYCSSGTDIGYVGVHDTSAGIFIPSDK